MDLRLFYFRVIFEVKLKNVLTHVKSIFHIEYFPENIRKPLFSGAI